jgi:hypothetical protein
VRLAFLAFSFPLSSSLAMMTLTLLDVDAVAPHFFKPADLDSLGGTKKGQVNAKAHGAAQLPREGQQA